MQGENERLLAELIAQEALEILFGGIEEPDRRGGCLITLIAVLIMLTAAIIILWGILQ